VANPTGNALLRLKPFVRPYLRPLVLSTLVAFAMVGFGLATPAITGHAIDDVSNGITDRLWFWALLMLIAGGLESLAAYVRRYSGAVGASAVERDLREALFARLQQLPIAFHDGWQSGQLLSRVMSDLSGIRMFLGFGLIFLLVNITQFLVVTGIMFLLDPQLTLFTFALGIALMVIARFLTRRNHRLARQQQDDRGDLATVIEEAATGIRIIKAFGRSAFITDRFRAQADTLHRSSMGLVGLRATFWPIMGWLPALNLAFVVAVGGRQVTAERMSLGDLAAFMLYLLMLSWPIRSVGWILAMAEDARSATERFFEVMDAPRVIFDSPDATPFAERPVGSLRFEGVRYTYPGTDHEILRGIDLELRPGETMALVGATGSGKTTLASLVPRLIDPTHGRVLIDGRDLRDVTLPSLRAAIGVAFEDPVLFSMSARENLLLGHPDATEEEIRRAIEVAHATFVDDLPWGLDTRIGEQGYALSGGQRQRLALARAIITDPALLVLDDPLSSVDVHTEEQIETALRSVLAMTTALIVVHRPSTVALCDRVALLHDGQIEAVGTHAELMASDERYRDILSMQVEIDAAEVV
jgi:ATP-binding cassette subfamily B protein